jgi:hypothetical protein
MRHARRPSSALAVGPLLGHARRPFSALAAGLLLGGALVAAGCVVMPSGGTPVLVDHRAGRFWSPEGRLLKVSEDEKRCRVAVRDRSLVFVRTFWTECLYVHSRSTRD